MKQNLLRTSLALLAIIVCAGIGRAQDVFDFSTLGYSNGTAMTEEKGANSTLSFSSEGASNKTVFNGGQVRWYQENSITVSANDASSAVISVAFEYASTNYSPSGEGKLDVSAGTYDFGSHTWTGNTNSVTFTHPGGGQYRVKKITVTVSGELKTATTVTFGEEVDGKLFTVTEGKDLYTAEGRSRFLSESKPLVIAMNAAPILRDQLVAELAMHARMNPDELHRAFGIAHRLPAAQMNPSLSRRFSSGAAGMGLRRPQSRFGSGPRGEVRPRVRIDPIEASDMRERILQNLLNYPVLASEFTSQIEDEFIGLDDAVSREILEVWRAAAKSETVLTQSQMLLESLVQSEHYAHYSDLLAQELVIQTPEEAARQELEIAFDRLELKRITQMLTDAVNVARPDIEKVSRLSKLQKELRERIEESARQHVQFAQAET